MCIFAFSLFLGGLIAYSRGKYNVVTPRPPSCPLTKSSSIFGSFLPYFGDVFDPFYLCVFFSLLCFLRLSSISNLSPFYVWFLYLHSFPQSISIPILILPLSTFLFSKKFLLKISLYHYLDATNTLAKLPIKLYKPPLTQGGSIGLDF